jgi:[ribulose-bisphosphate carboxylase]/[fructose-bisphosphate aldolase]-lysine N-methyltransferase
VTATIDCFMQEEKRILEGLAEWFRSRLKSLSNLEYYQERRLKRLGLLDDSGRSTFEDMIKINM